MIEEEGDVLVQGCSKRRDDLYQRRFGDFLRSRDLNPKREVDIYDFSVSTGAHNVV